MQQQIPIDPIVQKNKLVEISAERFGDEILKFYQEMLIYYAENHTETSTPARTVQKCEYGLTHFEMVKINKAEIHLFMYTGGGLFFIRR